MNKTIDTEIKKFVRENAQLIRKGMISRVKVAYPTVAHPPYTKDREYEIRIAYIGQNGFMNSHPLHSYKTFKPVAKNGAEAQELLEYLLEDIVGGC